MIEFRCIHYSACYGGRDRKFHANELDYKRTNSNGWPSCFGNSKQFERGDRVVEVSKTISLVRQAVYGSFEC